ncbi:MAG: hypothetical protein D6735_12630 [Acidobacteria bacterium]|nr:MAG: hypothetical protein D6735_12630 [Acidobacteriota bacterium]
MSLDVLTDDTRNRLKELSRAMVRFHKILLEDAKAEYEEKNGKIENVYIYFQLVLEDEHFAWLRRISYLIALIDEAVSVRHPSTEAEAQRLLSSVYSLFSFADEDEVFNSKLQMALSKNSNAVVNHNEILGFFR